MVTRLLSKSSLAVVTGILPAILGVQMVSAEAGPQPNPGYEIEAGALYCSTGGIDCVGPKGEPSSATRFVRVNLYNFNGSEAEGDNNSDVRGQQDSSRGDAAGTPQLFHLVCETDRGRSEIAVVSEARFGQPPPGSPQPALPVGRIWGNASVRNGLETSPAARASVNASAWDPTTNTLGWVHGNNVTFNADGTDLTFRGGFVVTIRGPITGSDGTVTTQGTQTCTTNVKPIPIGPPATTFENAVLDSDGDLGS